MYRKSIYLISSVLVLALSGPISWGLENHNALQQESITDPNLADAPSPPDGAKHEDLWVTLSWLPGCNAASHNVYIGDNFNDVYNGAWDTFMGNQPDRLSVIGFPGTISLYPGTTYYWRIDEVNDLHPDSLWKGNVWSFWIPPKTAYDPVPADGAKFVDPDAELSWTPGFGAKLHTVYFSDNFEDVNNATGGAPQETTTYSPGHLEFDKIYYWRVDVFYDWGAYYKGDVWSFTTADFIVVDDFESYGVLDPDGPNSNRIFLTWIDGYEDPTNGSLVDYCNLSCWWCKRCWSKPVHGGAQSMDLYYDNSGPAYYSEATLPLEYPRDWTEKGVGVLSLWFYGDPNNAPEPMYVAIANRNSPPVAIYHDNPDATLIDEWTEWNIDLQEFSNQGVVLTNVDSISIGFGDKNNPQRGGSGLMFIDDILLYRPSTKPEAAP